MRFLLVVFFLVGFILPGRGQESLQGRVYEINTRIALPEISIRNQSNQTTVKTDSAGRFRILAKPGDLLLLTGFSYQPDTILVIDYRYREVFLTPKAHLLKEVKVNSAPVNLGELRDPEFHGQKVVYQRDEDGNYKGGIAIRLSYWNKDSKKERRSQKRLKEAELKSEIYARFNPANVGKIVPLKGQALQDFIDLYRPLVEQYRSPEFDFVLYLNEKYRDYLALPEDQRKLPDLKSLSNP